MEERAFPRGEDHPSWKGDDLTYSGVHQRVRVARGRASEYACIDCGTVAAEWSYDGLDPDERRREDGLAYSLDPDHYTPRCHSCHRRRDHGDLERDARGRLIARSR